MAGCDGRKWRRASRNVKMSQGRSTEGRTGAKSFLKPEPKSFSRVWSASVRSNSFKRYGRISHSTGNSKKHILEAVGALGCARPHMVPMRDFDYRAPAEFFAGSGRRTRTGRLTYRRFESAAEAIRFAIEELSSDMLTGAVLEVHEERYDGGEIRGLYESESYPLARSDKP